MSAGRLYTTRAAYANEDALRGGSAWEEQKGPQPGLSVGSGHPQQHSDLEFVSRDDLQTLQKMGKLLCSYSLPGVCGWDHYALSLDTIDAVAREGRACVVPIDLEGITHTPTTKDYTLLLISDAHECIGHSATV